MNRQKRKGCPHGKPEKIHRLSPGLPGLFTTTVSPSRRRGDALCVRYDFEIENLCRFRPTLRIDTAPLQIKNAPDSQAAQRMLFSLGMVELISYWKCACPPRVVVECGGLDEADNAFLEKALFQWPWRVLFFATGSRRIMIRSSPWRPLRQSPFPTSRFATVISI